MPRLKFWEFFNILRESKKPTVTVKRGRNMNQTNSSDNSTRERFQQMHDLIAKKAYELYEKRGSQNGSDTQDWLEAERSVKRSLRSR